MRFLMVSFCAALVGAFPVGVQSATPSVHQGLKNVEVALGEEVIHAYQNKDYPRMQRVTGLLLKAFPESSYGDDALYWMARFLIEDSRQEEALYILDKIDKYFPKSQRAKSVPLLRAVALAKAGDWEGAEKIFKKAARK